MATTLKASSTTSSDGARFAARCALFFAPLVGLLALTVVMLHRVGELYTPDQIVPIQARTGALYLPEFHDWSLFFPRYFLVGARAHLPEVMVLGSSRVKTVRSVFFRAPEREFNAGIPATNTVGTWRAFLGALPQDRLPRVILLDINPWWFRSATRVQPARDFMAGYSTMQLLDFSWRRGFWWSVDQLRSPRPRVEGFLGVQGQRERSGLRPDGSLLLSKREPDEPPDVVAQNILDGTRPFFHDAGPLSQPALAEMEAFLRFCDERGVRVVGYISGFKPSYFAGLQREPRLAYFFQTAPALAPLFAATHQELFDFLDASTIGCTDAEFLEPMHESDVCTLRTLAAMARRSATVASVVDADALDAMRSRRASDWELGF